MVPVPGLVPDSVPGQHHIYSQAQYDELHPNMHAYPPPLLHGADPSKREEEEIYGSRALLKLAEPFGRGIEVFTVLSLPRSCTGNVYYRVLLSKFAKSRGTIFRRRLGCTINRCDSNQIIVLLSFFSSTLLRLGKRMCSVEHV
jgi:hypothetical protein